MTRRRLVVTGVVQGVGFRPLVHRLAHELGLAGSVSNTATGVVIDAQGPAHLLDDLARRVVDDAPPMADVRQVLASELVEDPALAGFTIQPSAAGDGPRTTVPPDCATCDDCLRELGDPADRRFRHPFITCTNCGPRFTIVTGLPYDRSRTTMAAFPMCPDCDREYHDPHDRRFHAQPVACPDCGPHLWADDGTTRTVGDESSLARAQRVLADGGIVAVKGLGGFHLACRADSAEAVARLRSRKERPDKPLAVMASSLPVAARLVELDPATLALLTEPARPIVLSRPRSDAAVAGNVAPGVGELGVMLAYTPIHHLLMTPGPARIPVSDVLVMTSANVSDEPLCYRDDQVGLLLHLADLVLGHDRPIVTPCDDSVFRVVDGEPSPVRRSRGHAPLPVRLEVPLPATFAVGAELKNTVCVLDGLDAVCSQHLGDMAGWESQQTLAQTSAHVMALYEVTPTRWAADAHPAYQTRAWAARFAQVPLVEVQHHRAHAASLLTENHLLGTPCLVACFDGTGYGDDGAAWGGEWLLAGGDVLARGQAAITRVASLVEVAMVGGDNAVREPWRLALAHLRRAGIEWSDDLPPVAQVPAHDRELLATALVRSVATVPTTSMGRLFDAVSALLGVRQVITYEAQAAIDLETLAATVAHGDPADWTGDEAVASAGGWGAAAPGDERELLLDPAAMLQAVVDGLRNGTDRASLALGFHVWVARAVLDAAESVRTRTGIDHVGLTGGVFGNVLLLRGCAARLRDARFEVVRHRLVPCNDGGLSLGQAVLAAADGLE